MQIQTDVSLKDYSTMRIGGLAKALVHVGSKDEIVQAVAWAHEHNLPWLVLGGGSNVIFKNGYDGLVIVNDLKGFDELGDGLLRIGAGEKWDDVVARTVADGWHGIEFLSAIPGTAGATPVQNVGAYGAQISDVFVELEAYDTAERRFVTLGKDDCKFAYRDSIFKSPHNRHYIITNITLRLNRKQPAPPFYESLQKYFDEHGVTDYTPGAIREAVTAIRAIKLPDPSVVANTGSFFKNPIVDADVANKLTSSHPDLPNWPMPNGQVKLAAGWLIEHAGLRGYAAHGMRTHDKHALVLINDHAQSYDDLAAFRQEIVSKVLDTFGVTLEQEPELL